MPTLIDIFLELEAPDKLCVHLSLCRQALAIWEAYAQQYAPITYVDSVIGMQHTVEIELPHEAYASVAAGVDRANVARRYYEPIVAMQDDDLEFPDQIEMVYYAIYNLFQKYIAQKAISDTLIIEQALSATADSAALLRAAIGDCSQPKE